MWVDRDNSSFTVCFLCSPRSCKARSMTNSLMTVERVHVHLCQRALVANTIRYDTIEEINVDSKAEYTA